MIAVTVGLRIVNGNCYSKNYESSVTVYLLVYFTVCILAPYIHIIVLGLGI